MFEEILTQNGFSIKEAKVYLAVLEIGEATMSMLARKTKIERSSIYDIVADLQQKGCAFIIVRKKLKYVSPLSPSVLIDRFKHSASRAEAILPELLDMAYKSL